MTQAFILGAGLGTRLQPLTEYLPKPLVPLFHRPLTSWTIDACRAAGITRFAINTHHIPDAWEEYLASAEGDDADITLFHEPELLETGGGLKNIADWMEDGPLLVHNGDIYSDLPLEKLIAAHKASGLPVTLAVRSTGHAKHIALNKIEDRVTDIRNKLGKGEGTHLFTGIYCINREFLDLIPAGEKISVIPAFLELAKLGKLGAIVLDSGKWLDLGDPESYLLAHRELFLAPSVHPHAMIGKNVTINRSVIGPFADIGDNSVIEDSVVWPSAEIPADSKISKQIVCF
ncbi:NTP transferase domain-containing protein [Luteolibacter pohnpeiensis]|uniref:NTP transferase domain-containing protein n=1 Tax=Luteolibacter pohnpeiensis TaxID=454153 RepID=A0A934VX05_9BACT|nr:sugar phosphate nucleotidyltransferase [Luteolibacter pohnpeiensis]MBK1883343.1 NTP transferase domain-containing protein [Luteolibacter pohnpeiensis]